MIWKMLNFTDDQKTLFFGNNNVIHELSWQNSIIVFSFVKQTILRLLLFIGIRGSI